MATEMSSPEQILWADSHPGTAGTHLRFRQEYRARLPKCCNGSHTHTRIEGEADCKADVSDAPHEHARLACRATDRQAHWNCVNRRLAYYGGIRRQAHRRYRRCRRHRGRDGAYHALSTAPTSLWWTRMRDRLAPGSLPRSAPPASAHCNRHWTAPQACAEAFDSARRGSACRGFVLAVFFEHDPLEPDRSPRLAERNRRRPDQRL